MYRNGGSQEPSSEVPEGAKVEGEGNGEPCGENRACPHIKETDIGQSGNKDLGSNFIKFVSLQKRISALLVL